jgi:drug/metabolite transporter (DMT)-like permease
MSAATKTVPRQNLMLGISLKILAVSLLLVMAALIKSEQTIPTSEIIFFRSFCAILPIAILLGMRGELKNGLKTKRLGSHILRAIIGVSAMTCMFLAVRNLPLPDATAIHYATPLMIVVLSAIIFKENVRLFRWSAVLIGFLGVLIIIWPNLSIFSGGISLESGRSFGVTMALTAAFLAAGAQVSVRTLIRTESSATIVLYFSIAASFIALFTMPFGWVWPSPGQLLLLVTVGVLGGLGQICMTESYRHADMSVIAPFEYSSLILSVLIGYFIFGEQPTIYIFIGGAIVVAAGIAIIWREHRLGLERAAARKLTTPHG